MSKLVISSGHFCQRTKSQILDPSYVIYIQCSHIQDHYRIIY